MHHPMNNGDINGDDHTTEEKDRSEAFTETNLSLEEFLFGDFSFDSAAQQQHHPGRKILSLEEKEKEKESVGSKTKPQKETFKKPKRKYEEPVTYKKHENGRYTKTRKETDEERYARSVRNGIKHAHKKVHEMVPKMVYYFQKWHVGTMEVLYNFKSLFEKENRYAVLHGHYHNSLKRMGYDNNTHVRDDIINKIKGFVDLCSSYESEYDLLESLSLEDTYLHRFLAQYDKDRDVRRYWGRYHSEKRKQHLAPHLSVKQGVDGRNNSTATSSSRHRFQGNVRYHHHDINGRSTGQRHHGRRMMNAQTFGQNPGSSSPSATDTPTTNSLPLLSSADCFTSDPRNPLCIPELPENFTLCIPNIVWPKAITGNETCRFFKPTTCVFCWERIYNFFGWWRTILAAIVSAVNYIDVVGTVFPFVKWIVDLLIPGGTNNKLTIVDYVCLVKYLYDMVLVGIVIYLFYLLAWPLVAAFYAFGLLYYEAYTDFMQALEEEEKFAKDPNELDRVLLHVYWDSLLNPQYRTKYRYREDPRGYKYSPDEPTSWYDPEEHTRIRKEADGVPSMTRKKLAKEQVKVYDELYGPVSDNKKTWEGVLGSIAINNALMASKTEESIGKKKRTKSNGGVDSGPIPSSKKSTAMIGSAINRISRFIGANSSRRSPSSSSSSSPTPTFWVSRDVSGSHESL